MREILCKGVKSQVFLCLHRCHWKAVLDDRYHVLREYNPSVLPPTRTRTTSPTLGTVPEYVLRRVWVQTFHCIHTRAQHTNILINFGFFFSFFSFFFLLLSPLLVHSAREIYFIHPVAYARISRG